MKKFFAIITLLGILLQTFSQVVIVAEYYANKNYIAKNLCENRNKPQMHCDGKCCLKKKLAKESKEQAPTSRNQKEEVNLFCEQPAFTIHTFPENTERARFLSYNDMRTAPFHHAVFHPPAA